MIRINIISLLAVIALSSCGTFKYRNLRFSDTDPKANEQSSDLKTQQNRSSAQLNSENSNLKKSALTAETIEAKSTSRELTDAYAFDKQISQAPVVEHLTLDYTGYDTEVSTEKPAEIDTDKLNRAQVSKGLSIAGFILGLLSFLAVFNPFFIPIPILGIIFSWKALKQIKSQPDFYGGKGLAIAGLVLSSIWFILMFIFYISIIDIGYGFSL